MIEYSYFQNTILLPSLYWFKFIVEVRVFYFSTNTYRRRKLKLLQKASFHSLHQSAIINLIWGERQDFEINKPEKGWKTVSRQNGHLINHCIPETIKFSFRVILLRRIKYLWDNCLTKNYHTVLFLLVRTFSRHLVFDVLFYERKDCPLKGDSEATINSLSS